MKFRSIVDIGIAVDEDHLMVLGCGEELQRFLNFYVTLPITDLKSMEYYYEEESITKIPTINMMLMVLYKVDSENSRYYVDNSCCCFLDPDLRQSHYCSSAIFNSPSSLLSLKECFALPCSENHR